MIEIDLDLTPEQYYDDAERRRAVVRQTGIDEQELAHIVVLRRSLDCRSGRARYHTRLAVYRTTDLYVTPTYRSPYRDCHHATPVVIVGAGPAGLFAALRALELGLRPILVERGQPVAQRRRDIALLGRSRQINPNSNWCFGEGGAGTFSDGKLYTRSTKRGNVDYVLHKFVEHGADPDILIDAHAHIGTDRLGDIVAHMRDTIEQYGGEYHFNTLMTGLVIHSGRVCGIRTQDGDIVEGCAVILATGHSARDVYEYFTRQGYQLQPKAFAMGVRVEHPQALINSIQYHAAHPSPLLPPASYNLVTQVGRHGVFSFCMCPGGVIVPAATADGQQVVNGMSNSHRSSPFANSGIAVTIDLADVPSSFHAAGSLALLRYQQYVEQQAFHAAGNTINAPAQRLTDFCNNRTSTRLNPSNYVGACVTSPLHQWLPRVIVEGLQQGFRTFDRKMHGFYTDQASLLAVESRTSSPVRIPRGDNYQHPDLPGLYPVGEGAGYAGGIVSSAIDGVNSMERIALTTTVGRD